jgi:glycogen debranching enzyme
LNATDIETARSRSLDLVRACVTKSGFVASSRFDHYRSVWARDACITSLGALASDDTELIDCVGATLDTLARCTSSLGHVPAIVRPELDSWDWAEGGVIDSGAWFVIIAGEYLAATGDLDRARGWWPTVEAVMRWLAYQDVTGSGLISVAPSTDWMDAALTRSGRTLHANVLYAWAAQASAAVADALGHAPPADPADLSRRVNAWFWPDEGLDLRSLYPHGFAHDALRVAYWEAASANRTHYLSHIIHAALVDVPDVLANLLAVVAGVADAERSRRVCEAMEDAAEPHPTRTLLEPVEPGDPYGMLISAAEAEIPPRWRNRPGRYHNGAAWPFVGGFHVVAEIRAGNGGRAVELLERLAGANALGDWSFPEWIDATGQPAGAFGQAWNAGTFLYAYEAVESGG